MLIPFPSNTCRSAMQFLGLFDTVSTFFFSRLPGTAWHMSGKVPVGLTHASAEIVVANASLSAWSITCRCAVVGKMVSARCRLVDAVLPSFSWESVVDCSDKLCSQLRAHCRSVRGQDRPRKSSSVFGEVIPSSTRRTLAALSCSVPPASASRVPQNLFLGLGCFQLSERDGTIPAVADIFCNTDFHLWRLRPLHFC